MSNTLIDKRNQKITELLYIEIIWQQLSSSIEIDLLIRDNKKSCKAQRDKERPTSSKIHRQ